MNPEIKTKWVEALRSGKYDQGSGYLRRANNTYCCLGVLCDIIAPQDWGQRADGAAYIHDDDGACYPPAKILEKAGLTFQETRELAHMNDSGDYTFEHIADSIEEKL